MCSSCWKAKRRLPNCRDQSPTPPPPRPVHPSDPRISNQSNRSNASTVSTDSQRSVNSIESNPSIGSLTTTISRELASEGYSANRLEAWLRSLHPSTYKKNPNEWHPSVLAEYNAYKQQGQQLAAAHQAYQQTRRQYGRPAHFTPEQHIHLAELAVRWGAATVSAAQARNRFLEYYRSAYNLSVIGTHIDEVRAQIQSGQNAVAEARLHKENAFRAAGRQAPGPNVFQ